MTLTNIVSRMTSFWDGKHETEDISSLTGSSYKDTVDFLNIEEYIKEGITILEIGVGLG